MEVLKYREIRILPSEWVEYLTDSSNDKAGASDNSITADNADITVEIIGNTLRQAGDGLGEVEGVVKVVFLHTGHPEICFDPIHFIFSIYTITNYVAKKYTTFNIQQPMSM